MNYFDGSGLEQRLRDFIRHLIGDADLKAGNIDVEKDSPETMLHKLDRVDLSFLAENPLLVPTIAVDGPVAHHDMPCAVNRDNHAVLDLSQGVFKPSWECQEQGWHLIKADTKFQRWLIRKFFKD